METPDHISILTDNGDIYIPILCIRSLTVDMFPSGWETSLTLELTGKPEVISTIAKAISDVMNKQRKP